MRSELAPHYQFAASDVPPDVRPPKPRLAGQTRRTTTDRVPNGGRFGLVEDHPKVKRLGRVLGKPPCSREPIRTTTARVAATVSAPPKARSDAGAAASPPPPPPKEERRG